MVKYTLGALIALVILGATSFMVIARLNDGNAETLPASPITLLVIDPGPTQQSFDFEQGRPVQFTIDNRTTFARALVYDGDEVEQLSNFAQPPPGGSVPRLYIVARPGKSEAASLRFTRPGTYVLKLIVPGTESSFDITARVK